MHGLIVAVTAGILSLVPHWTSDRAKVRAKSYATIIVEESQAVQPQIDPFLVVAIAFRESSFRPKVKGKRGEVGLMQVLPQGALTRAITRHRRNGKGLMEVRSNIRTGIGHLNYWQKKCGEDRMDVWLSAYNSGQCKRTKYYKRIRRVYCNIKPGGCNNIS